MKKQNPAPGSSILETNGVRLDLTTHVVVCDGVPLDLSPVEFEILEILMRSEGRVILKSELERVLHNWQISSFEDNLEIHVNQLKRKLERGRRIIHVMEGGYLFVAIDEHGASNYQLT